MNKDALIWVPNETGEAYFLIRFESTTESFIFLIRFKCKA